MFLLPVVDDDISDNHRWNASLDGRAIHSFLLWVEPYSNAAGGGCARDRALAGICATGAVEVPDPLPGGAVIRLTNGPSVVVLRSPEEVVPQLEAPDVFSRTTVEAAVQTLHSVGLRYLIDLAVGVIVVADSPVPDSVCELSDLAWLHAVGSEPTAWAEALVREAARSWIGQWLHVEEKVGMRSGPLPDTDERWLTGLFADCLAFQLLDRLARTAGPLQESATQRSPVLLKQLRAERFGLTDRLGQTTGMGIVAELIGTSYPCWNRRQFAVKSPFDYIREIRPLTDAERDEHLAKWFAPSAVR